MQRYKRRVRDGFIAAAAHGNKANKNALKVDLVWLVKPFKALAAEVGEVVPVRVRMQKTQDGMVKKYYSRENYTLLPATFTWDALYEELHKFVELGLRVYEPARSTFRKLLSIHCPTIRIRSSQFNVCDMCTIYQTRMRQGATADKTEELSQHTESPRRIREYKKDKAASQEPNSDLAVIVTDFSQNLTIPAVTTTPSQWYFCSLLAVNLFDIFYENDGTQTNYVYDEFASGKGSDQINSMLQHFIRTVLIPAGKKHLVVYADNCSGQNKNNHVIRFFLAQVQYGTFERVDYKFFCEGPHKKLDRSYLSWERILKSYKPVVEELYKKLVGVQQYQVFTMTQEKPGVVQCKKGPDDESIDMDLRRKWMAFSRMWSRPSSCIKIFGHTFRMSSKRIRYTPPLGEDAKAAKQARREHRAAMAVAAKANQVRRGRDGEDEGHPVPKKSRK
ncbi:hypothetical protein L915_16117 [Phytophthora nicotianae]|uniref:DUF7869 domain-containing protein n=1 Tax=Phytophthora nicotianae TaxID=4792 RepID=W2G3R3_PHYNI|nr:hypothetical protein L915_16117 [Phytophthora nicotianae]